MPRFTRQTPQGPVCLNYTEQGAGFPVLLLAPGGMRSSIGFWDKVPFNPLREWSQDYRVIAMDQRNAGESTGPINAEDGWQTYAADQLALLDHLGVDRFVVAGMCIGGPYGMGLATAAPERVAGGILMQPIGLDDNREAFYTMFDSWAEELAAGSHSSVPQEAWLQFRSNLFDGEFLFNLDTDAVRQCQTPLLILCGDDLYHPKRTSLDLAELAPNASLIDQWKQAPHLDAAMAQCAAFLEQHAR